MIVRRPADFDATLQSGGGLGKRRIVAVSRYGEASSSTRPLVSTANRPVITAAIAATIAKVTNTDGRPPASIMPTTVGPIMEANRSQAVDAPTPSARTRVG